MKDYFTDLEKKGLFILLIVLGSITLLAQGCVHSSGSVSQDLGLQGDILQQFDYDDVLEGYDSTTLTGQERESVIRIRQFRDWSLKKAEGYVSDKMFVIHSLYRKTSSPYPGPLSNTIECAEEFKPEKKEHLPFDYHLLYTTERLTYGACSWDIIKYRAILYYTFCESTSSFYQIELFIPIEEYSPHYEESLKSLTCLG